MTNGFNNNNINFCNGQVSFVYEATDRTIFSHVDLSATMESR